MRIIINKEKVKKATTVIKKELLELSEKGIQAVLVGDFFYLQEPTRDISRVKKSFCSFK